MNLNIYSSIANNYKNNSQIVRNLTENWVHQYICCPYCGEDFELKSKNGNTLGKTIVDGAVNDIYKNEEIVLDYSDFDGNVAIEEANSFDNRKDFLINEIIKYMIRNAEKHCEELDKPKEHIYNVLKELQNYLPENFND